MNCGNILQILGWIDIFESTPKLVFWLNETFMKLLRGILIVIILNAHTLHVVGA